MIMTFIASIRDEDDEHIVVRIYDLYFERMKKQAYDILHNHADADDAVQQALIGICLYPSRFEGLSEDELRAMLRICVRNQAFKIYNQNKRRDGFISYHEDMNSVIDINAADTETPEKDAIEDEFAAHVHELISQMDVLSQDLLTLSLFYQMRNSTIADLLGMDRAKVNTYLSRAKKRLRVLLIDKMERKEDEDD